MNPDFQVDTEGLRQDAAAVTAFAGRIAGAASAPVADPSPHWAATAAATLAADSVRRLVTAISDDTAATATHIREAASAYEAADARAARRLTGLTAEVPAAPAKTGATGLTAAPAAAALASRAGR
ncbi:type VII secretion target [Actinoplanes philippinensis]|uniref:type VII secretion target n=1 Tax=Actinoplanes philippinensis TaxID=35752 RepID=UPI00340B9542